MYRKRSFGCAVGCLNHMSCGISCSIPKTQHDYNSVKGDVDEKNLKQFGKVTEKSCFFLYIELISLDGFSHTCCATLWMFYEI